MRHESLARTFATRLATLAIVLMLSAITSTVLGQSSAKPEVDLALVLAVDTSGSINEERWTLEKRGYAAAFRSQEVVTAIRRGALGQIAVALVQWSNPDQQATVIEWTLIKDATTASALADRLEGMPRASRGRTSISAGITYSTELLRVAPFRAERKVIDVSGDGPDNTHTAYSTEGFSSFQSQGNAEDLELLLRARDAAVKAGITINGLPIFGDVRAGKIDEYYKANVIGGPGAFMIVAKDFVTFAEAVRRKLVLEIGEVESGSRYAAAH